MRVLVLTDRYSDRGGADAHVSQVVDGLLSRGLSIHWLYGHIEGSPPSLPDIQTGVCRGLASKIESSSRLGALDQAISKADIVHVQNVMNPLVLRRVIEARPTLVTVQDHRVFCPGAGKTLPDGQPCQQTAGDDICRSCLPEDAYRRQIVALTENRLRSLEGANLITLSGYMADEMVRAGCPRPEVIPPWVERGKPATLGRGFVLGGRMVTHKGADKGWEAWRRSRRRESLTVAGLGPLVGKMAGAEKVGWLSPGRFRDLLHRSRALLFPGQWQEPFGIAGVESLAEGTPVILRPSGGTSEWSEQGCAFTQGQDEEDSISQIIERMVEDDEWTLELGKAGQEFVIEKFARAKIESRLFELYEKTHNRR